MEKRWRNKLKVGIEVNWRRNNKESSHWIKVRKAA
jgi:hypothetical protein